MKRSEELSKELERIVKILIDEYKAEKIILFGSFARNEEKEWADIDLIIVKDTGKPFYKRLEEVVEITKPEMAADIIVYTPEEMKSVEKSIFYIEEVEKKGKVIYERGRKMV
ncbi:MAG: nucleotidyltransferase domain-containing protein [Clostridiaceae bacterium]|nr:nucleotidyltransferase domain-containing protein [Clostridiaceae bacterium]